MYPMIQQEKIGKDGAEDPMTSAGVSGWAQGFQSQHIKLYRDSGGVLLSGHAPHPAVPSFPLALIF